VQRVATADHAPAPAVEVVDEGARRRDRWSVVALYVALVAVAWLVVTISIDHFGLIDDPPPGLVLPHQPWLSGWARWDAGWYFEIVRNGYSYTPGVQSTVAFFPGYPLLIWTVDLLPIGLYTAAVAVTLAAGLSAVVLFSRWCEQVRPHRSTLPAVAALLVSPFAFYLLGAVYSDAVFLAAAVGAFLLLERGRPGMAGLVGAIATLTRPVGPGLVFGLALRAWELRDRRVPSLFGRPRISKWWWATVVVALAGFAAYCIYLAIRFDDPFAFIEQTGAPGWDQAAGPRTWFKVRFVESMLDTSGRIRTRNLVHLSLVVGALATVPTVWRRYGRAYALYVMVMVAVPAISSRDFMGLGRYSLAAFPVYAAAGEVLERWPRARFAIYGLSALVMFTGAALFARGEYIS
jgi:hypothetical protein